MPDPTITGFIPKWLRDEPLGEPEPFLLAGSIPDTDPHIVTRLIPKDHGYVLSARTLGKVLELKQNLVLYAARDVAEGLNANFADLRSLKEPLTKFATLTIEPFETGSFVIPARLEAAPLALEGKIEPLATDRVVERFNRLLAAIDQPDEAASMSIGALFTCKELGKLLKNEVESIEWTTIDREHNRMTPSVLTPAKAEKIERLLERRKPTEQVLEKIAGRLTAFDTVKNTFQLSVSGQKQRVKGTVMAFHAPWMCERLGQHVELEGIIERRGAKIMHLVVHRVVEGDDE
ncbi:unnamed protein product [Gemmata massiliana]|uniref:Uncharacterized protein n=1 Tax=Gemmata massiliana TaxID=1210884 RepID=A0A6P2DL70_9BACT|nr:hypothetical protein [Gemmata massiliana]VTS01311.1 unnamed protein product [Gemmata massiliana]